MTRLRWVILVLCCGLLLSLAGWTAMQGGAANQSLPSENTVNEFLRHYFGFNPNLKWRINAIRRAPDPSLVEIAVVMLGPDGEQPMRIYVTPDGEHAIAGDWLPFAADPFASTRQELERGKGPARGPESAPVTVVEFGDLECPSCKAAQPTIRRLISDEPNMRFVFQHFPLTQIHPWAFKAASWGQCIAEQSNAAFWRFADAVYDDQEQIDVQNADAKLGELAEEAGANRAAAQACSTKPETAAKIKESMELGKKVEVTGTPTLFISGRKIANVNGMPYEVLKQLVDFQASLAK